MLAFRAAPRELSVRSPQNFKDTPPEAWADCAGIILGIIGTKHREYNAGIIGQFSGIM